MKEQKKCKIALILNDEFLRGEASADYKIFREKVIDIELLYDSTAAECAEIAFAGASEKISRLRAFTTKLKINNIRILKKIERLAMPMIDLLADLDPEVTKQAFQSLTLLSWCFYSEHENIPSLEYVKKLGYSMLRFSDKEELDEKERLWQSILRDYGFQNTDEFDLEIAKAVETGYITDSTFLSQARKLNEQVTMSKSQQSFRDAWDAFHNSFADNQQELLDGLFKNVKKDSRYISPAQLDATVKLFRELGDSPRADELIAHYCEVRKDEKSLFDLDNYPFARDIKDQRLIQEFSKLKISLVKRRTIKEVLEKIAGKNSWGGEDVEILSAASPDEFYTLFKTEEGDHLSTWINTCLMFGRFMNASEKDKKIAANAIEALNRIGQETPLNARRVAKFGVVPAQR